MNNENRLVPDFRSETVQTYTETYTPEGGTEQTATYKIGTAHPIISGILDKLAWVRTHVAAVWWNRQAGVTLKDKIDEMDREIAQLKDATVREWIPLLNVVTQNTFNAFLNYFNTCPDWSIVEYCTSSGSEGAIWMFKRTSNKSSIGILVANSNLYHVIKKTDDTWECKLVSKQ